MADQPDALRKHERSSPSQRTLLQVLTAKANESMPGNPAPPHVSQYRNNMIPAGLSASSQYQDASSRSERLPGIHSIFMSKAEPPAHDASRHRFTPPNLDRGRPFATASLHGSPPDVDHRLDASHQLRSGGTHNNTVELTNTSSVKRAQNPTSPSLSSDASRPSTAYPFHMMNCSTQAPSPYPSAPYSAAPQPYIFNGTRHQDSERQIGPTPHGPKPTTPYGHRRKTSSSSGHSGTWPAVRISRVSVPGHGRCFRYSDGNVVPAEVDGIPVNPQYGITKQGFPRKRGSQACLSCKTKKIRCELKDPLNINHDAVCKACVRTSSECQWSDDSLGSERHSSPGSSSNEKRRRKLQTPSDGTPDSGRQQPQLVSSHDQFYEPVTYAPHSQPQAKRPKLAHRSYAEAAGITRMQIGYRASIDPLEVNQDITLELLNLYFMYRNGQCNQVIPMAAFLRWVNQCATKTTSDLMIIYACMAVGSIYTLDPKLKNAGIEVYEVVRNMEMDRAGQYDSQLALTRLHLALYSYAKDKPEMSFEYTSTACRALAALRYNTEAGCASRAEDAKKNEFCLEPLQVIEFRRRVFWLAYLTEVSLQRYNGHCSGSSGLLPNSDIFVRVPSSTDAYDGATTEVGPFFNQGNSEIHPTGTGVMAAFVAMSSLWGEVTKNIFHMANKTPDNLYAEQFETFHTDITRRVDAWKAALPEKLRYSPSNTSIHLKADNTFATYFILHSIHHGVVLKLNRHFHHKSLSVDRVKHKLRTAHVAAQQYLDLIAAINKHSSEAGYNGDLENALSQPFPGYATLMSSDIVTRGGPYSALANANNSVIEAEKALQDLSKYIAPAKKAKHLVNERVRELGGWRMMLQGQSIPDRGVFGDEYQMPWKCKQRIERIWVPEALDAVYGVRDHVWHDAVWGDK